MTIRPPLVAGLALLVAVLGLGALAVRGSEPGGADAAEERIAAAADLVAEARTARLRFRVAPLTGQGVVDVVCGAGQLVVDGRVLVSDGRRLYAVDEDGTRTEQIDLGVDVLPTSYLDLLRGDADVEELGDGRYRVVVDGVEIEVTLDDDGYPVRQVVRLPVGELVLELSDFGVELPAIVSEVP